MLRHPKGYRSYVPPGELLLGTMCGTVLVLAVLSILPSATIAGIALHIKDGPVAPPYWSLIGWALLFSSAACGGWAIWVRRNLDRLATTIPAWLLSIISLVLMVSQLFIVGYWMANYSD